ncbi:transglycosylase domain-containing protein [Corynebacterium pseudopelargi]|uniref:Penicillin-binding protein 2D n=1 Tax=Corynebacterium pseudopelargi TaxID=2080757 RepID=A0A3G6IWZ7_9CORY|nr:transglycosylase domain-containing protein [Corynebacterium pseudopelargi]AZA10187.1 Penicillin-binding protein 2D [Corynebacterium pseudopelargi]
MSVGKSLIKMVGGALAAGTIAAVVLTPVAAISAVAIERTDETMQSNIDDLTFGATPGVSTILNANDEPMAWLYKQRRYSVPSEAIAEPMKAAIVSIEDRRFYEHNGVDLKGNLRAMATNLVAGGVEQGASTLDQQYVKNYLLLVASDNPDEQAAATETSIPRKLREMRMASSIDENLSKDEILTRYLNLVPFGNNAYGVEAAAQTYFAKPAAELTIPEAAMLAGIVQSSSYFNPYTNPEAVTDRRNEVLGAMAETGAITPEDAARYQSEPLGVQEQPGGLPNGCIAAGDAGFFCDYVLKYLGEKGLDLDTITSGSYTIRTTLNPEVQAAAHDAVTGQVPASTPGVANVMNVIEPGRDSRKILAMTSSRDYGLDLEAGQTVLPQTASLVGSGAGSVFKVFTAGAALEDGYGLDTMLDVPTRYEAKGLGEGGADNCPANTYCVENSGSYASRMSLQDALAYSPNTPFVKLISEVGVDKVVDLSVKLGLRSYEEAGTFDGESSIADYMKDHNLGSYTLGPTAINALEMSNVAASIASDGRWCEPNPIENVTDAEGNEVFLERPDCEDAMDADAANALGQALSKDTIKGTGADAAKAFNWSTPLAAKTGTTESHQSAAFMGFNSAYAAVTYIYNDGTSVAPLCTSPVQQCGAGSLYGGDEPARTWFSAANASNIAQQGDLAPIGDTYRRGRSATLGDQFIGRDVASAERELTKQGYKVVRQYVAGDGKPKDQVLRTSVPTPLRKGSTITLYISDGSPARRPAPQPVVPSIPPVPEIPSQDVDSITDSIRRLLGQ